MLIPVLMAFCITSRLVAPLCASCRPVTFSLCCSGSLVEEEAGEEEEKAEEERASCIEDIMAAEPVLEEPEEAMCAAALSRAAERGSMLACADSE